MLKVIKQGAAYLKPCTMLLGGFDGIHAGHKTLVEAAKKYPYPVGIMSVLGCKRGGDLFTVCERERIYESAGIDFVWEIEFSAAFKNTSAEDFLSELFSQFQVKAALCGEDFRFGMGALGTPELLKNRAPCPVEVVALKRIAGEKVSASHIKQLLSEGDLPAANALLTHPYFIGGRVEHGRRVGKTIGFPTVNVTFPFEKYPLREGVYGGTVLTEAGEYPAIVNVGARPTFGVEERKVEAYLQGFDGNLYEKEIYICPREFYREIAKFESAEALRAQLERDKARLSCANYQRAGDRI